ncbi:MAG: folate-binding protein YgfZ [Gammaproteobacteria bacterium]|nr:MAG: folate-binding protein YgfZ [Gammaproteobacteria bacterium]
MKTDWKEFLIKTGAEYEDDLVAHYGNPEQELEIVNSGLVFSDLGYLGVIAAHGKDVESFLQNQFSNDISRLAENISQLNAYCSPKGRILGLFRLFRIGDTFYMRLPADTLDAVLQRLRMYVLRADVTLEDVSENFLRIGVTGDTAVQELTDAIGAVPAESNHVIHRGDLTVLRVPGVHPRFEVYATSLEAATGLWDTLNVRGAPVGLSAWRLTEIQAGIPAIFEETTELFVPQMVNLQLVDGLDFKKGCYPGQEIVARMQYLGTLKRRMYLGRIDTGSAPHPADELYTEDDSRQAAGRIVDAQPHPDGGYAALAVLQIQAAAAGNLHLGNSTGPAFAVEDLPYAFEP